jgi:hypothetical protein
MLNIDFTQLNQTVNDLREVARYLRNPVPEGISNESLELAVARGLIDLQTAIQGLAILNQENQTLKETLENLNKCYTDSKKGEQ